VTRSHRYHLGLEWTGNTGTGTATYRGYERSHVLRAPTKPDVPGSSDAVFRGDPARWNPEELLVASLSACHMLVYLHQAALAGVVVTAYTDEPVGEMLEDDHDSGQFRLVLLQPTVTITDPSMVGAAEQLHTVAHDKCFIASSMNFPVTHEGRIIVEPPST
jgi:organic hydroperoxide reductase OsmC/OhrA